MDPPRLLPLLAVLGLLLFSLPSEAVKIVVAPGRTECVAETVTDEHFTVGRFVLPGRISSRTPEPAHASPFHYPDSGRPTHRRQGADHWQEPVLRSVCHCQGQSSMRVRPPCHVGCSRCLCAISKHVIQHPSMLHTSSLRWLSTQPGAQAHLKPPCVAREGETHEPTRHLPLLKCRSAGSTPVHGQGKSCEGCC